MKFWIIEVALTGHNSLDVFFLRTHDGVMGINPEEQLIQLFMEILHFKELGDAYRKCRHECSNCSLCVYLVIDNFVYKLLYCKTITGLDINTCPIANGKSIGLSGKSMLWYTCPTWQVSAC